MLGISHYHQQEFQLAKQTFERLIYYHPEEEGGYFNLATILLREKRFNQAIITLKKGLQVNPSNIEILLHLAGIYMIIEDYPNAISYYTKIISLSPFDHRAYEGRATAYWKIGENNKAVKDLKCAKEIRSGFRLGIGDFKEEPPPQEKKKTDTLLTNIHTDDPDVLHSVGEIQLASGEYNLAVKTYSIAIKIAPYNPLYYRQRAKAYMGLGKKEEAEKDLKKAKELEK
jgi:tetratricopeptide (TPR) repeat protein